MTQRGKCSECENMILPQTAADNDGLCAQCVKISPELRAEKREYERRLTEGGQLNHGFTDRFGVCEYQNQDTGDFRYAYAEWNLREQVPEDLHVVQACPCCGVGMLWYPSRYHMPRDHAFSLLENALPGFESPDVEWLETDDFSSTEHGRG